MEALLKNAFTLEMQVAIKAYEQAHWSVAFYHLENAHVLGQRDTKAHCISHWWMFKVGIKTRDIKAVCGQVLRLFAGLIFSQIWVPIGNTGGSNVSAIKAMPIRDELKPYFKPI